MAFSSLALPPLNLLCISPPIFFSPLMNFQARVSLSPKPFTVSATSAYSVVWLNRMAYRIQSYLNSCFSVPHPWPSSLLSGQICASQAVTQSDWVKSVVSGSLWVKQKCPPGCVRMCAHMYSAVQKFGVMKEFSSLILTHTLQTEVPYTRQLKYKPLVYSRFETIGKEDEDIKVEWFGC